MDLHSKFPAVSDLRRTARRRIPHFVWEYLDSATGEERTLNRNREKLGEILFHPSILHGEFTPDLTTQFLDQSYALPVGIAPVGMSGLIWPGAERMLATAAARLNIPYSMSTVATQTPEDVAPYLGQNAWFQMYPPRDKTIREDMMARARAAGFTALILTVDVPVASRRERQTRGGLQQPPKLTGRLALQAALCPLWLNGIRQTGMPRMKMMDGYAETAQLDKSERSSTAHVGYLLRTSPDWSYVNALREEWDGPLIVKGVSRGADAKRLEAEGVDAIWVSNHAGRQFDASRAAIEALPEVRAATGLPVIVDSGFETGLDVLRGLALGADFIMMGRPWHYALGALGEKGPAHLADIIKKDLEANMGQMGAKDLRHLETSLIGRHQAP